MSSTAGSAFVLCIIPAGLRDELLMALNEVLRNYREQRWEPSELNGGKLCEVAYTIIKGHIDGTFPSKASKPSNMVDACKALEKADANLFPRAIRVQIPRMLVALYEVRNNRGVGHVGGDVNPNLMDATAVVSMSKWIVAELIRIFHSSTTEEAEKVVEATVERSIPVIWNVGDKKRVLKPDMPTKDKIFVLLYNTKNWVAEETLKAWIEYSNLTDFRKILAKCHKLKLIEFDREKHQVSLSPLGISYVETKIDLKP